MPANLTPQYMEAEKRFKQAATVKDKIAALEEMMATIPKHKGTEKLQAELKKKMSALRKESEQAKKGGRRESYVVEREGARQIALVGAPNSGKSQLVRALTHAAPEVADYPYTTRTPIPGMILGPTGDSKHRRGPLGRGSLGRRCAQSARGDESIPRQRSYES
jgi:uncharacterized protein